MALLEYLKRYQPTDTEKYSIVAYHFCMYREIAETLEESAVVQLKSIKEKITGWMRDTRYLAISELPFASVLKRVLVRSLSYGNLFYPHVYEPEFACQ